MIGDIHPSQPLNLQRRDPEAQEDPEEERQVEEIWKVALEAIREYENRMKELDREIVREFLLDRLLAPIAPPGLQGVKTC